MRTSFFVVLLMFAGFALMGSPAFACGACKKACGAKTEKKVVEKPADNSGGGCGGCGGKTCSNTKEVVASTDSKTKEAGTTCGEGCGCKEGCKDCTSKKAVAAEAETGDVYVVVVSEMCCAGCGKSVAAKIKKVEGVASVAVDVEKGTITVTMKEGKTLDKAACETALKGTDFGVTSCDKQVKAETKKECECGEGCGCGKKTEKKEAETPAKPSN